MVYRGIHCQENLDEAQKTLYPQQLDAYHWIPKPKVYHHSMEPEQVAKIVVSEPENIARYKVGSVLGADYGKSITGTFFDASGYACMHSRMQPDNAYVLHINTPVDQVFINPNDYLYRMFLSIFYNRYLMLSEHETFLEYTFGFKFLRYLHNSARLNGSSQNRLLRFVDYITHDVDVIISYAQNHMTLLENELGHVFFSSLGLVGGVNPNQVCEISKANPCGNGDIKESILFCTEDPVFKSINEF
jgi:hypothetical protein